MNHVNNKIPYIVLLLGALTAFLVFSGNLPFLRPALVFTFFLLCPGLAFIRLLRPRDLIHGIVLAVALSLAIDTMVAMVLLYTGTWSYQTGLLILIGISLAGAALNQEEGRDSKEDRDLSGRYFQEDGQPRAVEGFEEGEG